MRTNVFISEPGPCACASEMRALARARDRQFLSGVARRCPMRAPPPLPPPPTRIAGTAEHRPPRRPDKDGAKQVSFTPLPLPLPWSSSPPSLRTPGPPRVGRERAACELRFYGGRVGMIAARMRVRAHAPGACREAASARASGRARLPETVTTTTTRITTRPHVRTSASFPPYDRAPRPTPREIAAAAVVRRSYGRALARFRRDSV